MKKILTTLIFATSLLVAGTAHAAIITFIADLTGAAEAPPVPTAGSGFAIVVMDPIAHTMTIDVTFEDLTGTTTAAHVHCCTAVPGAGTIGVATELPVFTGFPLGVTSGTYNHVFDTTLAATWSPAFITNNGGTPLGAEAAFIAGLTAGRGYLNVHSTFRPGGEIRGFMAVPEPLSLSLLGLGLGALALRRKRR